MRLSDFDFDLPAGSIAQHPATPRDSARLLVLRDGVADRAVRDLPRLLRPGDMLVVNDTRVLPVRLAGRRGDVARFYAAIEDGLGEAYDELMPGSEFLTRLNARPRNPKIQYSLLLGSGGLLDDAAVEAMRRALKRAGESNRFVKFLGPRLDAALADLDEVKRGRGDGAVSIARGRLAGVEDVVVLPFNHLTMIISDATAAEKRLRREIIMRLTR